MTYNCVWWDVKPYSISQSISQSFSQQPKVFFFATCCVLQ